MPRAARAWREGRQLDAPARLVAIEAQLAELTAARSCGSDGDRPPDQEVQDLKSKASRPDSVRI